MRIILFITGQNRFIYCQVPGKPIIYCILKIGLPET